MACDTRRIIEAAFPLDEGYKKHPAVILSVPKVYEVEQYYICAMISSSTANDCFSFPLSDSDVTNPFSKKSQIRIQLITPTFDDEIIKTMPVNYLTIEAFERLVDHVNENVFGRFFSL